ncbi:MULTISPECIES: HNH endonuclease [Helcococcus]|uniref:Putative HNH nuclease YajD n=1 Tax=Helcococcus bovis TaxID=3153252 RepID=A0ABW9F5V0_9FIRM
MPRKPKSPCSYPGCPELVDGRFCKKHEKEYNRNYEKYQRDPRIKKRYGSQWRKIRKIYLNANPLCEECLKNNKYTKANEVHHILPLSRGGTHSFSNLMALCKPCHSRISVLDGDRFG